MENEPTVEDLIVQYTPMVRSIARRMCPWNPGDEDLIQCGLIGLWQAAEKWDRERPFGPLARVCVERKMCTYMKKLNREPEKVSFNPELHSPAAWDDHTPMEVEDAVLRKYPPDSRKARAVLTLLEGHSPRDAGQILHIRPARLRTLARTAMRSSMGDDIHF